MAAPTSDPDTLAGLGGLDLGDLGEHSGQILGELAQAAAAASRGWLV